MNKKLYVTKGLPASGKSTWAKEKVAQEPDTVIVNRDKIREMLKGIYSNFPFGSSMENLVTKIEEYTIIKSLLDYNVIIDSTGFRFNFNHLAKHPAWANRELLFDVEIVDFTHVPLEECIKRDKERAERGENSVGEEVIKRMYEKYLKK